MQGVDFIFIGQELDDNDGAGKGQGHGYVNRMNQCHAESQGNKKTDRRGKKDLPGASGQGDRPGGSYEIQIQLEAHDEKQQGDADFGQELYLFVTFNNAEYERTCYNAGRQEHNNHWLAQFLPDNGQQCGQP